MSVTDDVYQWITERIIKALESGVVPWRRPWLLSETPMNLVSKKPYRGVNVFSLSIAGEKYRSRYWLTAWQARQRGGYVRKGEIASMVVFWKVSDRRNKDGEIVIDDNGRPKKSFILRYSNVFNVEQCEKIKYPKPEDREPVDSLAVCENIMKSYTDCPPINHGGDRAYYATRDDRIQMPHRDTFDSSEEYYSTLFHEAVHSTGHKSRINRKIENIHGSSDYAREELVAEMGAAMLCGVAHIECKTIDNSAAYIANWLGRLQDDHKLVVKAASQAQRAAEYIQGNTTMSYDDNTEDDNSDNNVARDSAVAAA